jgi:hypothetical protein
MQGLSFISILNVAVLPHRKPASTGISHNSLIAAVLKTATKEMHFKLKFAWKVSVWDPPPPVVPGLFKIHAFVQ